MTNRLPLALGICGKILRDLDLSVDDSWQGVRRPALAIPDPDEPVPTAW
jgi:hypothetical protein